MVAAQVNAAGGVLGMQVEVLPMDDQCKPEIATNAATKSNANCRCPEPASTQSLGKMKLADALGTDVTSWREVHAALGAHNDP